MKLLTELMAGLLGLLLISACASIPQKKSADDCLVVIKIQRENPEGLRWLRQYRLEFSPEYPGVNVPNQGSDEVVILIREPAVKISAVTSQVTGNASGPPSNQKADFLLPYDPGHAVVADFSIMHRLERTGTNNFVDYFYFVKLSDSDKDTEVQKLISDSNFSEWNPE